jgi:small acid-soluble spore protein D (minor alpha/beta-type SASP)
MNSFCQYKIINVQIFYKKTLFEKKLEKYFSNNLRVISKNKPVIALVAIALDKKYGGRKTMSRSKINVPEAKQAMDNFKMEAAREVGVDLKQGYNGDLTSRQAGSVGGQMVKKMIEDYENKIK